MNSSTVVLAGALAARVEILLPVGVGLVELSPGCIAGPSPPGVSALRGRVVCRLGDLDTPDPRPGNNFAERALP